MAINFLKANWQELIMANYEIPTEILEPYLPTGIELDLWEGKAWASLVGFMFNNTRIFHLPIPLLGSFEEINLRFYVKRKEGDAYRRGVVFINESVPFKVVAWVANSLYKEHYTALTTKHNWLHKETEKRIQYDWKLNKSWYRLQVDAYLESLPMQAGSFEEFIFEHYYGYTKLNNSVTKEYKVNHPKWLVNKVTDYVIDCNFSEIYGNDFGVLNRAEPANVFLAAGSEVTVGWKRRNIPV